MKIEEGSGVVRPPLTSGLYLVATPIGNLRDITLRALDVLGAADLVVCEDTRVTAGLMTAHGLKKKLLSYNDHNADQRRPEILERLAAGESVALVSDAGTPLISDPGFRLVRDCLDLGYGVTAIPGPSAPLAALQLSGLPTDRFVFMGFLPPKSGARQKIFQEWARVSATLIFFETAPRLTDSLRDMVAVLGAGRPAAVVREITKMFEESRRGALDQLLSIYEEEGPPKGEIVIVVGPPAAEQKAAPQDIEDMIRAALARMSVRDAAAYVAEATGHPKKDIYERALVLAKDRSS